MSGPDGFEIVLDLGMQPLSDSFLPPGHDGAEYTYPLRVVRHTEHPLVRLDTVVPREKMFHDEYPYHSSTSTRMQEHFSAVADRFLRDELTGDDPFIVEIGSNDGIMLSRVADAGRRHLGVDPAGGVGDIARERGVRVRAAFFDEQCAREIRAEDGPADVVYAANTMCHIPYLDSILRGVDALLTRDGILVFEDPYLGDIVERASFDQIYDEHFHFFSATSVQHIVAPHGFELVDVERLGVHGGEVRYTVARRGARPVGHAVAELVAHEQAMDLHGRATLEGFAARVRTNATDLVRTLTDLRAEGKRIAGFGATAKSATVTNYAGIGPDLVPVIYDSTPAKQGRLSPGAHIPIAPSSEFRAPYPDYTLLFAWNHAEEIMEQEVAYRESGGRWLVYVPDVHVV
ncbi:class I SAM-dependent methyltransferase [Pseudonocardia sp. NPDC046786]|uniref:class I SAM-dependent methyltransferase n=1 Tax=Pseudonocardia sp. NPDC046786 TaxID=3155471 RepID=UPI0033E2D580